MLYGWGVMESVRKDEEADLMKTPFARVLLRPAFKGVGGRGLLCWQLRFRMRPRSRKICQHYAKIRPILNPKPETRNPKLYEQP